MSQENSKFKSGFVSIIGLANSGKSTFLNACLNENIAIVSNRPQTTRKNIKGIYNDENSQIIFIDTPGIHRSINKLDEYMDKSIDNALLDIDVFLFLIDVMTMNDDDFSKTLNILNIKKTKKILLLNKCDAFKKKYYNGKNIEFEELEKKIIDEFDKIEMFKDIKFEEKIVISSYKKINIKYVIDRIKNYLSSDIKYYNDENLTDESLRNIIEEMIRAQCLYKLKKEVPHGINVKIETFKKLKTKVINIEGLIIAEKKSHKGIIIGKNGEMLKNIGTGSRIAIEKYLNNKVNLKLNVVVKENWRSDKNMLIDFGFDEKNL